jgi:hypothetical protein
VLYPSELRGRAYKTILASVGDDRSCFSIHLVSILAATRSDRNRAGLRERDEDVGGDAVGARELYRENDSRVLAEQFALPRRTQIRDCTSNQMGRFEVGIDVRKIRTP